MPQYEFRQRKTGMSGTNTSFGLGIALIVVGLLTLATNHGGLIGMGILVTSLSLWNSSRVMVALREDYLEVKVAPISSMQMILYSEIRGSAQQGNKAVIETFEGKIVKIPLSMLEDNDAQTLMSELQQRTSAGKQRSL